MQRNIYLAYFLVFCKNSWFWLGIWIFYYLQFTDYAGIGLVETMLIATMTLTEIPTGAVADLFGRRKTLILAFALQAVGSIWMTLATSLNHLIGSVVVMGIGGTLYSGTLEALVYDSLLQLKQSQSFGKIIGRMTAIQLATPAICSVIGGFLYAVSSRLPFAGHALMYLLGFLAALFLLEPASNMKMVTTSEYVAQIKIGAKHLFESAAVRRMVVLLLSVGLVAVIVDEMLSSMVAVEIGLSEQAISVVWAVIYLIAAGAAFGTAPLARTFGSFQATTVTGGLLALLLIAVFFTGNTVSGVVIIIGITASYSMSNSLSSVVLNEQIKSRYRATALSTFNMLKNIPYVLLAFMLGVLADTYSARFLSMVLGIVLLCFLLWTSSYSLITNRNKQRTGY